MEVTRRRGLFATVDVLDFGLIRAGDKSKELLLEIVSNLEKGIEIEVVFFKKFSFSICTHRLFFYRFISRHFM